jgi:O-antigen ligase
MEKLFPLNTAVKRNLFWGLLSISAMSIYVVATLFFGQSLVMYFFALVLVFLSTVMHPEAGLYTIFICTMWFERYFTLIPLEIGATAYKIYPLDFCILFLALSLAARFVEGKIKWRTQPLDWFILIFGAVCSLGFLSSYWRNLDMALAFGTYKNYFIYAIIYVLCVMALPLRDDWQRLLKWLIAGGVGVFFFLAYGLINGRGLWSEFTPLSTSGERMIAGTHTFYLAMFFFWMLAAFLFREAEKKIEWWRAVILVFAMSFSALALVVSLVRHLWLAMLGVVVLWLVFLPGLRRRLNYLAVLGAVGILTAALLYTYSNAGKLIQGPAVGKTVSETSVILGERADVGYVVSGSDTSFHWRLTVWRTGYNAWIAHPFLGLGLGYQISGFENDWPFRVALREIHNDYLAMLYQLGVVGLIAVIELFIFLWYRFLQESDTLLTGEANDANLFFSFWSAVVLFMVGFSVSVYWDVNLFVIWWWLALAQLRLLWAHRAIAKKIIYDDTANK